LGASASRNDEAKATVHPDAGDQLRAKANKDHVDPKANTPDPTLLGAAASRIPQEEQVHPPSDNRGQLGTS